MIAIPEIRSIYNAIAENPDPGDGRYLDHVGVLLDEIDRLTPKWQEGEPPDGVIVWREGRVCPVETERENGVMHFIGAAGLRFRWGEARWALPVRPS